MPNIQSIQKYRITEISPVDTTPSAKVGDIFEWDGIEDDGTACNDGVPKGYWFVHANTCHTKNRSRSGTWCKFEKVADPEPICTVPDPTPSTCVAGPLVTDACSRALDDMTHAERKARPIWRGVMQYFPKACECIAYFCFDYTWRTIEDLKNDILRMQLLGHYDHVARAAAILLQWELTDIKPARDQFEHGLYTNFLLPFGDALAECAHLSVVGNEQQNPGAPLHWDRSKSTDHGDSMVRHLKDSGKFDKDGCRHTTKVLWRAQAQLEIGLEQNNDR